MESDRLIKLLNDGKEDRTFHYHKEMTVGDLLANKDKLAKENMNNFIVDTAIRNYLNELILPAMLEQKKIKESYAKMLAQYGQ